LHDVSASLTFPAAADPLRALWASLEFRRRALGYGAAFGLHALALIALVTLPPAVVREAQRAGQALDVRFYTVAGGPDADTDAPLFEPPLAGGETGQGPIGVDGNQGADGSTGAAASEDRVSEPAEADIVDDAEPEVSEPPAPVDSTVPEVDALPDAQADASTAVPDASIVQTAPQVAPPSQSRPRPTPAPPPSQPADPNQPIATAQPGPAVPRAERPAGPPSFADILARAESRMTPEDFRMVVSLARGVDGVVQETFCLSSSDANQEAFDCPEGSQLAAPQLAQYGLMGLGEEPPEFLIDMDRLAYQLTQTGAGDSAIGRILTSLREARRDAINTPDIQRQMARDRRNATDHLGVGGPITPDRVRDPSGEP
jgi:hypothetical protein